MVAVEVTADNAETWIPQVWSFASTLDVGLRCNASAVAAGQLVLSYPSRAEVENKISRDDAMVIVSTDAGTLRGYTIVVDDRGEHGKFGGCHCRWIGTSSPAATTQRAVYTELGDMAVARYGWLWGRVAHPGIRQLMLNTIPGCALMDSQAEIVTYKKP